MYSSMSKVFRLHDKRMQRLARHAAATARVFNRRRLRAGELVEVEGDAEAAAVPFNHAPSGYTARTTSWTIDGTLAMAFRRLTSSTSKKSRVSSRALDAIAFVAHALLDGQRAAVKELQALVRSQPVGHVKWLWIERAWDETPLSVRFGILRDRALPVARFWWRNPGPTAVTNSDCKPSEWRCLTWEEYRERSGGRKVELLRVLVGI